MEPFEVLLLENNKDPFIEPHFCRVLNTGQKGFSMAFFQSMYSWGVTAGERHIYITNLVAMVILLFGDIFMVMRHEVASFLRYIVILSSVVYF